jgi:hypothetical protein
MKEKDYRGWRKNHLTLEATYGFCPTLYIGHIFYETFLAPMNTERLNAADGHRCSCEVPVTLLRFKSKLNNSTYSSEKFSIGGRDILEGLNLDVNST